jgi:hypothetical protein
LIRSKGVENVSVEDLVAEIKPKGKGKEKKRFFVFFLILIIDTILISNLTFFLNLQASIPPNIKNELLQRIRRFLAANAAGSGVS